LEFAPTNPLPLKNQFPQLTTSGIDLLSRLVALDPSKRLNVDEALAHPFFNESPLPLESEYLPLVVPFERERKRRASSLSEDIVDTAVQVKGRRLF